MKQCCERVRDGGRWPRFHDCARPVTLTVNGKNYCTIHSPAKVAERATKLDAKWHAKYKKHVLELRAPSIYAALKDIRMSNAGSAERKRGWDAALAIIEDFEGRE